MRPILLMLLGSGASILGCSGCPGESAASPDAHVDTYGIYLNDQKVGWMEVQTSEPPTASVRTEMHARLVGMGTTAELVLIDHRKYTADGRLAAIDFAQTAQTGSVEVAGRRSADTMKLKVTAGGVPRDLSMEVRERWTDATALETLVATGRIGAEVTARSFDASVQKEFEVTHRLAKQVSRVFGGVETKTYEVHSKYAELGIEQVSWIDEHGRALEVQVGGFFVARLEPPETAKRKEYTSDLLLTSVVALPGGLTESTKRDRLTLKMFGFGDVSPPTSDRQKVTTDGDAIILDLVRDPPLPATPVVRATSPKEDLEATPFIQADNPKIIAAAKAATAGATTYREVIDRLTQYVFSHVRDEYVPSYSNAVEALETRRGDCTEHSVLFVALARALGIPARVAVGLGYWAPGQGLGWHAWAEVLVADRWYAVDPTWGQPIADATHVKLASGGPTEQARIVMLLGRLKAEVVETP